MTEDQRTWDAAGFLSFAEALANRLEQGRATIESVDYEQDGKGQQVYTFTVVETDRGRQFRREMRWNNQLDEQLDAYNLTEEEQTAMLQRYMRNRGES